MRIGDLTLLAGGLVIGISPWLLGIGTGVPFVMGSVLVWALSGAVAQRVSVLAFLPGLATLVYVIPKRILWEFAMRGGQAISSVLFMIVFVLGGVVFCWATGWLVGNTWRDRTKRHPL